MKNKKYNNKYKKFLSKFKPAYHGIFELSPEDYSYDKSSVVVLPVPYEQTTSYKSNTREGPRAIIEASRYLETYDEELDFEVYKIGIHTLPELKPEQEGPEKMYQRLAEISDWLIGDGKLLVALGGEHSITPGLVKGVKKHYPNLSVLQIDAHADLRDSYQGTAYSHASAIKRVRDLGVRTMGLGIRSISKEEINYCKKFGRLFYTAAEIKNNPAVISAAIAELTEHVYVTIDIDGFDPSYIPSTGTPEPGGLDWYEILDILRQVTLQRNIVGFDVVELAPIGGFAAPDFLTAKLVYKFLGFIYHK